MCAVDDAVAAKWLTQQSRVCERFGAQLQSPSPELNSGVSAHFLDGGFHQRPTWPVHGCRYLETETTTGWYLWAGESFSTDPDFFVPLHVGHLDEWSVGLKKFLALPPGWRFLKAGDYEDVWFDESLLVIDRDR